MAARPTVVIETRSMSSVQSGSRIHLLVTNKGPNVARNIEVYVQVDDHWMQAGPAGLPHTIPALAPSESQDMIAMVEHESWDLPWQIAIPPVKVRWLDQFGNEHSQRLEAIDPPPP